MKKHYKIIAILLAGSLLTVGGLQAKSHHDEQQCGDKMMHMMKKLDLTDAQHDAIKAIKDTQHANKMAHKEQIKPIREAMKQQVMSDNFDISEVSKLAHQKALLVESMTISKAQSMHNIHQQLTPEQRAKMMELKAKMHEKKMKHRHDH
jgi:protein CpxP